MTSRRDRHPLRVGALAVAPEDDLAGAARGGPARRRRGPRFTLDLGPPPRHRGRPGPGDLRGLDAPRRLGRHHRRGAQLGLMVGANTFRNPGLTAKAAVTVDHISGGRAWLGIGGAWFDHEHEAHGIDFGSGFGERLDWLEEAVAAMAALLRGEDVTSAEGGALRASGRFVTARFPSGGRVACRS